GQLRPVDLAVSRSGNWLVDDTALTGTWLLQPSGRGAWAVGCGVVLAWMQPPGKIVRAWQRRPDRTWFRGIEAQCVAPDGGLAVLEGTYVAGAIVSLFSR